MRLEAEKRSVTPKPDGDSHSKRKIMKVAECMATKPTSIQEAVSNGSEKTKSYREMHARRTPSFLLLLLLVVVIVSLFPALVSDIAIHSGWIDVYTQCVCVCVCVCVCRVCSRECLSVSVCWSNTSALTARTSSPLCSPILISDILRVLASASLTARCGCGINKGASAGRRGEKERERESQCALHAIRRQFERLSPSAPPRWGRFFFARFSLCQRGTLF